MRYSYGVLIDWLGLKISPDDCDQIDTFWSAAGFHRAKAAEAVSLDHQLFHRRLFLRHLNCMKYCVFHFADFEDAHDLSQLGMDRQENWYPDGRVIDVECWDSLVVDKYLGNVGDHHPCDSLLFETGQIHLPV